MILDPSSRNRGKLTYAGIEVESVTKLANAEQSRHRQDP
jgi:hypothetical protein